MNMALTDEQLNIFDQPDALGHVQDLYDPRTFEAAAFMGAAPMTFPNEYLIDVPFVTYQGQIPSCTAHATTTMKYVDEGVRLSPRFQYAWSKYNDGYKGYGTSFVNALSVLQEHGAAEEIMYPDENHLDQATYTDVKQIPERVSAVAVVHKSQSYVTNKLTKQNLMQMLMEFKKPLLIGGDWYQAYNRIGADGIMPIFSGTLVGGHAFLGVGWRTVTDEWQLICQNSFGANWGDHGRFYIPESQLNQLYGQVFVTIDMPKADAKQIDTTYKLNNKGKPMMDLKLLLNQGHVLLQETEESGTFYINTGDKLLEITPERQGLAALTVQMLGGTKGLAIPKAYLQGIVIEQF